MSATYPKDVYVGDGTTFEFPITFPVARAADVNVFLTLADGTEQRMVQNQHYWVRTSDWNVVTRVDDYSDPIAAGVLITIQRIAPIVQPSGNSAMSAKVFRNRIDSLTQTFQQLREQLDRTLHVGQDYPQRFATTEEYVQPDPVLTDIDPDSVLEGADEFVMTLTGTGFVSTSIVLFDGEPLETTYVSDTSLTAVVPAELLEAAAVYDITVLNTGDLESNALEFEVEVIPAHMFFVGAADAGLGVLRSTDGINWTAIDTSEWPIAGYPKRFAWNPDTKRLVGIFATGGSRIIVYTDDGITFSQLEDALPDPGVTVWSDIDYGDGKFIAIRPGAIATSTDNGETWAETTPAGLATITGSTIFYDSVTGKWIAWGQNAVANSTDGATWTLRTHAANATPKQLVRGPGDRIIAGTATANDLNYTDDGGDTWVAELNVYVDNKDGVGANANYFFAAGVGGSGTAFRRSANGATGWTNAGAMPTFPGGHMAYHPDIGGGMMVLCSTGTPVSICYWGDDGDGSAIAAATEPTTSVLGVAGEPIAVSF